MEVIDAHFYTHPPKEELISGREKIYDSIYEATANMKELLHRISDLREINLTGRIGRLEKN